MPDASVPRKRSLLKTAFKWFLILFAIFFFLSIIAGLLLKIPSVQNKVADKTMEFLSDEMETEVTLDYISLDFFNEIVLDGFYVQDQKGDTLLYSKKLRADITSYPWHWVNKQVFLEDVELEGANFNITRTPEDEFSTLQFLINKLRGNGKQKKPFIFTMKTLSLSNLKATFDNQKKGKLEVIYLKNGLINVNDINIQNNKFELGEVTFNEPLYKFYRYPKDTTRIVVFPKKENSDTSRKRKPMVFEAESVVVNNGVFQFDDDRPYAPRVLPKNTFDDRHWKAYDINMVHENFVLEGESIASKIETFTFKELSGFEVTKMASDEFVFTNNRLIFNGLSMKTPNSFIGDTLSFTFDDTNAFKHFNSEVYLKAKLRNSELAFEDIMTFFPTLHRNQFFETNKGEVIKISGDLNGKINSLKGKKMNLTLGQDLLFKGDFRSRDITKPDKGFLDMQNAYVRTSMKTLYDLIPGFKPPDNFRKLGDLTFKGKFYGFFVDFVAYGDLQTDLGRAVTDMTLKIKEGREKAVYSGNLSLENFDLGTWTGNKDLGIVTLKTNVKDGRGLTSDVASAVVNGTVENLFFRNYNYKNIVLNGRLDNRRFNGQLGIEDQNIDLIFVGDVNYRNEIPVFDFKSKIKKLNLKTLNLSNKDYRLSGDVDLNLINSNLSDMEGDIEVLNFVFENGNEKFQVDSILISSKFSELGEKLFLIKSDVVEGKIKGFFDIEQLPNTFLAYYHRNFPVFMNKLGVKKPTKDYRNSDFSFDFQINDAREFAKIIDPGIDSLQGVDFFGHMNSIEDELNIELEIPRLKYKNWDFTGLAAMTNLEQSDGHLNFAAGKTLRGKREFSPVIVFGLMERDTYEFGLTHTADWQSIEDINLDGKLFIHQDQYQVNFKSSSMVIGKREWDIPDKNFIRFGNNKLETKDFVLQHEDKKIVLESYNNNRGLRWSLENFNLDFIEELWDYKPLDFSGNFAFDGKIEDVFKFNGVSATAYAKSFKINDDDFGQMTLKTKLTDLKGVLLTDLKVEKGEQKLLVNGTYALPNANKDKSISDYLDLDIKLIKYPIQMLEYWVPTGIKNTSGTITSNNLHLYGKPRALKISGNASTENGKTTISYLNTAYEILDGRMSINDNIFDATGSILRDDEGNIAYVYGGIRHTNLRKLRLDVRIKSDRFLVLNTDKNTNAPFYGRGIGSGDVRFSGSFGKTDITVDATTGKGTRVVIPVVSNNSNSELSFINFVDKNKIKIDDKNKKSGITDLKGINLVMQLSLTEDAEMLLVFDERAGDIIKGTGKGDVEMKVLRDGTFSMIGDYVIEDGEYLFTMLNVVNKNFKVQKGGTIRWYGDPFGAEINLVANYNGLKTPISNLIIEYIRLLSDDLKREAAKATPTNLTMNLRGQLLKPTIDFDIDFPDLSGELKTYAQAKLRVLNQDENELNRQVFGLIVTRSFLPSDYTLGIESLAVNTLSELLTNQLSIYLTALFSDLVQENNFISGIDIQLFYRTYENTSLTEAGDNLGASGSTVQLNVNPYFLQDRLSVNFGGEFNADDNVNFGNTNRAGTFSAGDFVVEYALTKSRRLKLKGYASFDRVLDGGTRERYGGGLSYRREFETFNELFKGLKSGIKKAAN